VDGLAKIPWLAVLRKDAWAALRARATRHEFAKGDTVFAPTPDPRSVYLLERGRVRILRLSADGNEVTLGYVAAGEVFGELPGFGDHPRESFAVARTESVVWKLPLEVFRELVSAHPSIAVEVTRQMGERLKSVESRVEHLVFGTVRSRLAAVLLELFDDFGRLDGDRRIIDLALSQGELATLIGSTRQSVNAAVNDLKERGVLRVEAGRTEIVDPAGLRAIGESQED
jgi:CRP-like cAMP-binding protein